MGTASILNALQQDVSLQGLAKVEAVAILAV
jgi:hypothetical protein